MSLVAPPFSPPTVPQDPNFGGLRFTLRVEQAHHRRAQLCFGCCNQLCQLPLCRQKGRLLATDTMPRCGCLIPP